MITGSVKWFSEEKGYGFIARDGGGADAFIHYKDLQKTGLNVLKEGQRVEFEMIAGKNGKESAQNVRLI